MEEEKSFPEIEFLKEFFPFLVSTRLPVSQHEMEIVANERKTGSVVKCDTSFFSSSTPLDPKLFPRVEKSQIQIRKIYEMMFLGNLCKCIFNGT